MSSAPDPRAALAHRLVRFASKLGSAAPHDAVQEALTRTLAHPIVGPELHRCYEGTLPLTAADPEWSFEKLCAWLYVVVRYVVSEERRTGRRQVLTGDDRTFDIPDGSLDSLSRLIDIETLERLHACLDALDPNLKAALTLRLKEERSYHEIATKLERSPNTIATWIARGCREIARRFHDRSAAPRTTARPDQDRDDD